VEARELWGAPGVDGDRRLPARGVEVAAFIALWSCVTLLIALGWMVALDRATGAPPLRDRPLARLLPRGWL